jgi:hypothetical protein
MPITIEKINDMMFKVTVMGRTTTAHTVTVSPDYRQKLAPNVPTEKLIEKSFTFLLEREPQTNILKTFDLPEIQRYFPDYEHTIRTLLK